MAGIIGVLTENEKIMVTSSWKKVLEFGSSETGLMLFLRFFEVSPGASDYFKAFKGKTLAELANNSQLKAHGLRALTALATVIDNLGDNEMCVELLRLVGRSHGPRNIDPRHYEELGGAVVWVVEQRNGGLSDECKAAWGKIYGRMLAEIREGLQAEVESGDGKQLREQLRSNKLEK